MVVVDNLKRPQNLELDHRRWPDANATTPAGRPGSAAIAGRLPVVDRYRPLRDRRGAPCWPSDRAERSTTEGGSRLTTPHRITTSVLVAIGLAAGGSSALARPFDINANGSYVPAGSPSMQTQVTAPVSQPMVVRVSAPANGFDWADAGIGAVDGVALTMVGVGGALVASGRRSRRTPGTPAVTG